MTIFHPHNLFAFAVVYSSTYIFPYIFSQSFFSLSSDSNIAHRIKFFFVTSFTEALGRRQAFIHTHTNANTLTLSPPRMRIIYICMAFAVDIFAFTCREISFLFIASFPFVFAYTAYIYFSKSSLRTPLSITNETYRKT